MRTLLIIGLLLGQAVAWGQEGNDVQRKRRETRRERMRQLREKAVELINVTQTLGDWDEHYEYMVDATERVFERNGWDSESDLFSLEVIREVGVIPPWAVQERYDTFMEMVGDRYLLDEEQAALLQRRLVRLSVDVFSRHSDRIMEYASEVIQARAAGEPFTAEQVARWTQLAEPVFQDVRRRGNAVSREFLEELDPEQRELAERDLAAADRRMNDIERMGQKWKRGEWDPHDWGMEEDPIQNPGGQVVVAAGGGEAAERRSESAQHAEPDARAVADAQPARREDRSAAQTPGDDDAWARYVRAFIRKYHLNDEQQQRAWLLYRDAKGRDEIFEKRFQRQVEALRTRGNAADNERTQAAIRERAEKHRGERERLFNQLKRRLERLPTRAQRKNAEPGEIEVSEPTTKERNAAKGHEAAKEP